MTQYEKAKYIYRIVNIINGKCYVGQSVNPQKRFLEHTRKSSNSNLKIKRAVEKYGRENFKLEILYYGEDYNEQEKKFIKKYNAIKKGYNIAKGGNEPPPKKGEKHQNAKLKENEVKVIQQMLLSDIPKKDILKKFPFIRMDQINRINNGDNWKNEELRYPLREDETLISFEQTKNIIADIKQTKLSLKKIGEKYGLCKTSIVNINNGRNQHAQKIEKEFPIRKLKNKKFTSQQILEVKTLLKTTKYTYKEIEKITGVSYISIVEINNGNHYKEQNENYPLRSNNN